MEKRHNREMDAAVMQGVLIDTSRGAARAWAYMLARSVPEAVILRVLSNPARRRLDQAAGPPGAALPPPSSSPLYLIDNKHS